MFKFNAKDKDQVKKIEAAFKEVEERKTNNDMTAANTSQSQSRDNRESDFMNKLKVSSSVPIGNMLPGTRQMKRENSEGPRV